MRNRPTIIVDATRTYAARSARDAQAQGYADRAYWEYLEQSAHETRDYYLRRGDAVLAEEMLTRTLAEALRGNDGA